jgi:hypothetical protein
MNFWSMYGFSFGLFITLMFLRMLVKGGKLDLIPLFFIALIIAFPMAMVIYFGKAIFQ